MKVKQQLLAIFLLSGFLVFQGQSIAACNKPEVIERVESYIVEEESKESSWYNPISLIEDAATISSHEQMEKTVETAKYMDEKNFCSCYDELALDGHARKPIEEYCKGLSDDDVLVVMKMFDWSKKYPKSE